MLPFENLSRDSGDAYLARDLTEEITTRLIKVERLTVTSPTVVRRYRGSDDPRAVAQALRVAYLVSGSVRRDRDRLRISVELLRARDGVSPWTDVFDRRDTSLLDIQIQIAQTVAGAITGQLLPQERQRLAARPTRSAAAYDRYARGQYGLSQRTTRSLIRAIADFQAAARIDSTFGAAIAGEAIASSLLAGIYYDAAQVATPRDTLRARARVLSLRALAADSTSGLAWALASFYAVDARADRLRMLERAYQLDPHDPDVLHAHAVAMSIIGDTAGEREFLQREIDADPSRTVALLTLGMHYVSARNYPEAVRWLDSAITFRPEAHFFYVDRALARLHAGDTSTLRSDAQEVRRLDHPVVAEALLLLLDVARRDSAAIRARAASLRSAAAALDCQFNFDCLQAAQALAAAREREGVLAQLRQLTPRNRWMMDWLGMPEFDWLRTDPEYQAFLSALAPTR